MRPVGSLTKANGRPLYGMDCAYLPTPTHGVLYNTFGDGESGASTYCYVRPGGFGLDGWQPQGDRGMVLRPGSPGFLSHEIGIETVSPILFGDTILLIAAVYDGPKDQHRTNHRIAALTAPVTDPGRLEFHSYVMTEEDVSRQIVNHRGGRVLNIGEVSFVRRGRATLDGLLGVKADMIEPLPANAANPYGGAAGGAFWRMHFCSITLLGERWSVLVSPLPVIYPPPGAASASHGNVWRQGRYLYAAATHSGSFGILVSPRYLWPKGIGLFRLDLDLPVSYWLDGWERCPNGWEDPDGNPTHRVILPDSTVLPPDGKGHVGSPSFWLEGDRLRALCHASPPQGRAQTWLYEQVDRPVMP